MSQDLTGVNHFHNRDVISISFSSCCRAAHTDNRPPFPNLLLALTLLNVLSIWLRWLYQQGLFSPIALLVRLTPTVLPKESSLQQMDKPSENPAERWRAPQRILCVLAVL